MRQTAYLYVATAVAAVVMCCSLPYATRANLDQSFRPEGTTLRGYEMPAAAPIQFTGFPRALDLEVKISSIDLSVATLQGFIALSKNLGVGARWTDASSFATVPSAAVQPAKIDGKNHEASNSLPERIENNVDRIAFSAPVLAPIAFVRFCARYREDCKVSPMDVDHAAVSLTKERLAELSKVNRDVNRSIKPQENLGGVLAEEWLVAPRRGDCNDYAVTKRHELLARGWPSHSLLLAEVVVAWGEHHLVLVVRTREDDLVLDSLKSDIRPVSQITYQWVRAQQAENPKFWSTINVARADRVAMNAR
jgi:predicted transglutaminase-like cysteine proteinase